jgi:tetratricopeptide (TPR) repeat protein
MVASIKSRDNLFSLLFTFWSLRLLILPLKKENLLKHAGGLTLYFLALIAKLDAAGLVIFTPIYHLIATSPIFNVKKLARSALFLYILFMITFHLRMNVLYNFIATADFTTDIGKVTFTENPAAIFNHSIDKLAAALYTNIIYLQKILIPFDLRYYYGFKYYEFPAFISLTILSASVFHFLAIGVLGWAIVNKKKAISVGILGYICFIAYALNLAAPMAGVVADRYAAQSTLWMMLLVSSLLMMIPQKKISVALLTILLVFFSCVSAYRVTAWKDGITLIERDAPHLEKSYEGMRIAASVYKTEADSATDETLKKAYLQKALHCAQKANEIYPQNTLMNSYEGSYWFELGNYEKAIEKFRDALAVDSNKINTLTFLGDVFYTSRQPDSSLFYYQKAFAINKNNPVLINNISTVYYESGQKQAALQFNLDLIEKDSTTGAAWENLGYYYLAEKDSAMAIQHFKKAIQYGLSPTAIPVFIK